MATYIFDLKKGGSNSILVDSIYGGYGDLITIDIDSDGLIFIHTISLLSEVSNETTVIKPSTKTTIKTQPIDWNDGDTISLDIDGENNVTLQNLTTSEAVFLFNPTSYNISIIQDISILINPYQSFNFEIFDLGSFSFSNNAPMVKTYKFGNYNYMLNNITYNDGNTYLGLVRYDITDGKCHVFHLGRDFLSNFSGYSKETMYIPNNMFYVTNTGDTVMILQAPTYLVNQSSNISYFVFILTGTQIFYVGTYTTTKNADETFMLYNNQVIFEDGDAIGYFNNSFNDYKDIIVNGDIYWGDQNRVILDDISVHNLSISNITFGKKPPLTGLIGFANDFQNSRAEVYFYDNIVRSVVYKSLPDMNNTLDIFSDDTYTVSLDDNNIVTGGLYLYNYKTIPTWDYNFETTLNRVGFSFFGSGKDISYIRFLNGFYKPLYSEGWEVKGNYITYLPSIFNNALYCSNLYTYYVADWYYGMDVPYSPTFFVLTADFKFYRIYQSASYDYPDIVELDTPSYDEPIDIINMPNSLEHFGGLFSALDTYGYGYPTLYLFVVNPATGYPCIININPIDVNFNTIIETLNQEDTFQNPKLISQSQVAFTGTAFFENEISSSDFLLTVQEYPLFIVDSDGYVWARGKNNYGQLGLGDTIDRVTFSKLSHKFNNPIKILSYKTCTYFIYANGDIYCAGKNINNHFNLSSAGSGIFATPVKSLYNYRDYKQIIFSEERITAINAQNEFTYSGIDFPYNL